MLKNKYYWVRINGSTYTHIPMLYNVDGRWCLDTLEKRSFITTAQLTRLYGSDCVIREVDLRCDVDNTSMETTTLHHMTDGRGVIFGNKYFMYFNQMCRLIPIDGSGYRKLIYK
ncbi:hypothetical protein S140_187 [Shewanella sp. phage 1/40]|uniref:hypothetical protein n=1 Tax=Shewanella sp. phage 1/40 TaxID=1458860 RepID=UPI0004F73A97|nr:hypothetical protein S140_187 [Shewanella sp. phage 1/40]AHK11594.1 hypothetical protein S140_187 [Shewanella sp. phage 1/40]